MQCTVKLLTRLHLSSSPFGSGGRGVRCDAVAMRPCCEPRRMLEGCSYARHKFVSPGGGKQCDAKGQDCRQVRAGVAGGDGK